jgi:hypothetical protein
VSQFDTRGDDPVGLAARRLACDHLLEVALGCLPSQPSQRI